MKPSRNPTKSPPSRKDPDSARIPDGAGHAGSNRFAIFVTQLAADGRGRFWLGILLFLLVAGLFLPTLRQGFITYDDPVYVTNNAHVTGGLTGENMRWAFLSTEASNWHPLTWLSHMADCQLYGLHPWGHHLTSLLLHALNATLLFVVLRRMTGAVWRSLFVAALFGLHPLHVESVAWISERKDVLSTTFWMLVLWAYVRRVELIGARSRRAWIFQGLALLFSALGLMCKSMLVTVPCVLLLLDYWPLHRWEYLSAGARWRLLMEKIPYFALSAAASAVTFLAQGHGGTMASAEDFPWPVRLANALLAYCTYLGKCFFPAKLAVFYPYFAEQPPLWQTVLAGLLLAGITTVAVLLLKRRPYLLIGWLWFVGTLVPVIGLVQIGGQSMADRYTYVPLIGVFVMLVWTAGDAAAFLSRQRVGPGLGAVVILSGCAALTFRQLGFWQDGTHLFRHALAVTENNWVAHANLSATLAKSSPAEANAELQETMRIIATFAETHDQKGIELQQTPERSLEAIEEFRTAIRIMPVLPGPHYNLGIALANIPGRMPEAVEEFREAARLKPDFADAHYNLGVALASVPGRNEEAIAAFESALKAKPDLEQARSMIERLRSGAP